MAKKKSAKATRAAGNADDRAAESESSAAESGDDGRTPGRPSGATNHDYSKVVIVRGVMCPHCHSENVVVAKGASLPSTEANGRRADRHRMLCRACDRRFIRITEVDLEPGDANEMVA